MDGLDVVERIGPGTRHTPMAELARCAGDGEGAPLRCPASTITVAVRELTARSARARIFPEYCAKGWSDISCYSRRSDPISYTTTYHWDLFTPLEVPICLVTAQNNRLAGRKESGANKFP